MTRRPGIRWTRGVSLALVILGIVALCPGTASAEPVRVAVLELGNSGGLSEAEVAYLSDLVRTAVVATVPASSHLVMTRESIQELLPPGIRLKDCLDAVCEVEIGRMLGADYVISGDVLTYGEEYRLILKLHDCESAAFLTSQTVGATDLSGLETKVSEAAGPVAIRLGGRDFRNRPPADSDRFEVPDRADWFTELGSTAVVRFESEPAGAAVWVDGRLVCTSTPCSRELSTGLMTITMERSRYRARQDMVHVANDAGEFEVSWNLTPDFGWLLFDDLPEGLILDIDGQSHTVGQERQLELDARFHMVRVIDPRYQPTSVDVRIDPGRSVSLSIELVPREGALRLSAVDADDNAAVVDVRIDGQPAGSTPLLQKLLVGRHVVELRGEAGSWRGEVDIVEAEITELAAPLGAGWSGSMGLVRVDPGQFFMGSPPFERERDEIEDRHQVDLSYPFLLGATEVTQADWFELMETSPARYEGVDRPVERVSWFDAILYCNALSHREGLTSAYRVNGEHVVWNRESDGYRLPTEAEWEYACRAGSSTRFATGDDSGGLRQLGQFGGDASVGTSSVASLQPNTWGLYDMHGNVWEWCWNWSAPYPTRFARDPVGPGGGRSRVIRGGAFDSPSGSCRSAKHNAASPNLNAPMIGFRVARNSPGSW